MTNEYEDAAEPVAEQADPQPSVETVTDEALAALIDEQAAADHAHPGGADPEAVDPEAVDPEAVDPEGVDPEGADLEPDDAELTADAISEEAVVALIAERDDFIDQLQRAKAEFANARRRSDERLEVQRAQAAANLVEKLLPVLDSCEIALGQGIEEIRPISDALFDALSGQGLERVDAAGEPFDPELHEAVIYEAGEGEQVVIETLRTGYRWNNRVLRAPMVKVQG